MTYPVIGNAHYPERVQEAVVLWVKRTCSRELADGYSPRIIMCLACGNPICRSSQKLEAQSIRIDKYNPLLDEGNGICSECMELRWRCPEVVNWVLRCLLWREEQETP